MAKFISNKPKPKKPSPPKESSSEPKGPSFWSKFSFLKWLDPFTYVDLFIIPRIKRITDSSVVEFIVNAFFALVFAFIIYSVLGLAFGTASPLVIVYSGSMEPALYRGDVMALSKAVQSDQFGAEVTLNRNISGVPVYDYASPVYSGGGLSSIYFKDAQVSVEPVKSGNVVVYQSYPTNLPIIHRAIVEIHALDGNFVLTKGDNQLTNPTFDADCGPISNGRPQKSCITFYAVPISSLEGKAFFTIPKVGCIKLWLFDDLSSIMATGSLPPDFKGIC